MMRKNTCWWWGRQDDVGRWLKDFHCVVERTPSLSSMKVVVNDWSGVEIFGVVFEAVGEVDFVVKKFSWRWWWWKYTDCVASMVFGRKNKSARAPTQRFRRTVWVVERFELVGLRRWKKVRRGEERILWRGLFCFWKGWTKDFEMKNKRCFGVKVLTFFHKTRVVDLTICILANSPKKC